MAKSEHFKSVCKNISHQSRSMWREREGGGGGGRILTQRLDIANGFVQHFSSTKQLSQTNLECYVNPSSPTSHLPLSWRKMSYIKKLSQLDERKATGSDRVSAKLLRMVAPAKSNSLTSILNACLTQSCFPSEWKKANVTPVPETGDMNEMNNYHPISVIPMLAKVFECIVRDQLFEYVEKNKILNKEQAGFRPNRSTQDVLL